MYNITIPVATPYVDHDFFIRRVLDQFPEHDGITCGGPSDAFIVRFPEAWQAVVFMQWLMAENYSYMYEA